jgi:hypothetical protein
MSRASGFMHHESERGSGSIPAAGTANQAVHPSGVGKLVAASKQRVTTAADCGKVMRGR